MILIWVILIKEFKWIFWQEIQLIVKQAMLCNLIHKYIYCKYYMDNSIFNIESSIPYISSQHQPTQLQMTMSSILPLPKQLYLKSYQYNIYCKELWIQNCSIFLRSSVTYSNGLPITIKPALISSFDQAIDSMNEGFGISLSGSTPDITFLFELENCLGNEPNMTAIKDKFLNCTKQCFKLLDYALCVVGKNRKFNKIQKSLKKEQLSMRREVLEILKSSQRKDFSFQMPKNQQQKNQKAAKKVKKLVQIEQMRKSQKLKHGGFCYVEPVRCLITEQDNIQTQQVLAVKKLKNSTNSKLIQKMKRQIQIVNKIINSKYTCQYYNVEAVPHIYMSYTPISLRDLISKKDSKNNFDTLSLIKLSRKIVSGVKTLHQSGIIHRDLKPENILISQQGEKINIIDFGQSTIRDEKLEDANIFLSSTFPYSPMECLLGTADGFNNEQIDYWSVNMILYEIVFKCLPFSFNKSISVEIVEDWSKSPLFQMYQVYRKRRGLEGISEIMSLINIFGLKIKQNERLSLDQMSRILQKVECYYNNCLYNYF